MWHQVLLWSDMFNIKSSGWFCSIPKIIGTSIPMKATFFITYIMVDGWAGVSGEILRLKPMIIYHLKNFFTVKTEKDREEAMDPGSLSFNTGEPQIQLYFLLGLVYAVVTPILLPFIIVFFGLAYVVFRHQVKVGIPSHLCGGISSYPNHIFPAQLFYSRVFFSWWLERNLWCNILSLSSLPKFFL